MSQRSNSTAKSYSAEEIKAWLVSQISEQLGVDSSEIDVREPLDSYGLDSAQAMLLISKAEKLLQFELSPVLLWHYPTIEALAERLVEEFEESETEVFEL